jgi:hypothetical protein
MSLMQVFFGILASVVAIIGAQTALYLTMFNKLSDDIRGLGGRFDSLGAHMDARFERGDTRAARIEASMNQIRGHLFGLEEAS